MKYANAEYTIDKEEDMKLRRRIDVFIRETGTRKSIQTTMITTYGLSKGGYSDDISSQITLDDLFSYVDF